MTSFQIMPGGKPFYYPGNRTGCLLVHGYTGMPSELRWLGQHLHAQGYTVYCPRLAGHGTHVRDLDRIAWKEWLLDVYAAYHLLRPQCDRIFVVGLSGGAALSFALAVKEEIDGLVGLSSFYEIDPMPRFIVSTFGAVIKSIPKTSNHNQDGDPFTDQLKAEQLRRGEEPIGHPSYPAYPVKATAEFSRMLRYVHQCLPRVTAPTLFIHSRIDPVARYDHMQKYHDAISSDEKETITLENSQHVITEDIERETVYAAVADFIARHNAS